MRWEAGVLVPSPHPPFSSSSSAGFYGSGGSGGFSSNAVNANSRGTGGNNARYAVLSFGSTRAAAGALAQVGLAFLNSFSTGGVFACILPTFSFRFLVSFFFLFFCALVAGETCEWWFRTHTSEWGRREWRWARWHTSCPGRMHSAWARCTVSGREIGRG
ncbi:hypothetical protein DFH08DRAFT_833292, partial [Mycena albidolilacea]